MRPALLLAALAAAFSLSACSTLPDARPWSYVDHREMEARPGLFTGPSGQFVVYRE